MASRIQFLSLSIDFLVVTVALECFVQSYIEWSLGHANRHKPLTLEEPPVSYTLQYTATHHGKA